MARYSDLNLDFIPHPITGDISTLTDMEALKRSVRNLVLTGPNDRRFRPELEAGVHRYLFEPMTSITAVKIKNAIEHVIKQFEPRVEIIDVIVVSNEDKNSFDVTVVFRPKNTQEQGQLTITLERVR